MNTLAQIKKKLKTNSVKGEKNRYVSDVSGMVFRYFERVFFWGGVPLDALCQQKSRKKNMATATENLF